MNRIKLKASIAIVKCTLYGLHYQAPCGLAKQKRCARKALLFEL